MKLWILFAGIVLLTLLILWAIGKLRRTERDEREKAMRVRSTRLYSHLCPVLTACEKECVEQVVIRRDGVRIRLFVPAGAMRTYIFEKHGFEPLNDEAVYALAQAVSADLRVLRESDKYSFRRHMELHENGDKEPYYEYDVHIAYKNKMCRSIHV